MQDDWSLKSKFSEMTQSKLDSILPVPIAALIMETVLRVVLLGVYFWYKSATPSMLHVADVSEYVAYSHPFATHQIIPSWALYYMVILFSVLAGVVTCVLMKALCKDRVSAIRLFQSFVYYGLAASLAFTLTAASTNIIKTNAGRLRPDFLNRCFPSLYEANKLPHILMPDAGSGSLSQFSTPFLNCEPDTPFDILDGRKSFPSGHSSYTASVTTVASIYFYLVMREVGRIRHGLHGISATIIMLIGIALPAYVGCTRVFDRRHHPTDVVGGLALGLLNGILASVIYFREPAAIPQVAKVFADPATGAVDNFQEMSPLKSSLGFPHESTVSTNRVYPL